jgi:hypothetical protein
MKDLAVLATLAVAGAEYTLAPTPIYVTPDSCVDGVARRALVWAMSASFALGD